MVTKPEVEVKANAVIKLSASEISSLLCYPVKINPFLSENIKKAIQTGSFLHMKLGYTNSQQFTRITEIEGQTVQITGIPDRIDYENGVVEELKTFHTVQSQYRNRKVAFVQLVVYEFLTGLKKGKAILFDVGKGEVVEEVIVSFNEKTFEKILKKALELKKLSADFLAKFAEIQKEE